MRTESSVSARGTFCWSVWPHFILNAAKCAHLLLHVRFSPLMALMWAFVGFDVGLCCLWCQETSEARHRNSVEAHE